MATGTMESGASGTFTFDPKFAFDPPRAVIDTSLPPVKVGAAEIRHVPEIAYKLPIAFLTDDEALLQQNADWLSPRFLDADGNWDMIVQSWIIIVDDKVVLLDPCTGNGRHNPALPMMHMLDTPYIERFAATGIRPEQVDYVFCTHLHGDHCGWNTQLRGGRYVPSFPNARYIIVRREFDRWDTRRPDHQAVPANTGVFENSVLPVLEAGLAELVDDRHRISESLAVEPAHGHTAGHSMLHLTSGPAEACFVGDAFHHPLEIKYPDLDMGSCEDFAATVATRRRIIAHCLERSAMFIPAHFPAPHMGWIRSINGEASFEPYAGGTA
jgi:glyoxylase-like metal-dependent hydrolase (beta-lactamase superfamily II)